VRTGNASKSPGAHSRWLAKASPSTAWLSFYARRKSIAPTWKRRSTAPAFRFISTEAPGVLTLPGERSTRLLKCATEGLSARRFAEYLSLVQVLDAAIGGAPPAAAPRSDQWVEPDSEAVTEEETTEGPERRQAEMNGEVAALAEQTPVREGKLRAPWRWEQLLVDSAVIGSRDRWRRRLDGLANELRAKLAELSDDDEIEAAAIRRTLDDLAAFTAYALPLIDLLDGWPDSAKLG